MVRQAALPRSSSSLSSKVVWTVVATVLCPFLLTAQTVISGDLFGVITDPSGAVIRDAAVELRSLETGQRQMTTTDDQGVFRFTFLKPGTYTTTAAATGFARTRNTIKVSLGQVARADLQLKVAGLEQVVTVSSGAVQANTENGDLTSSLLAEQVGLVPNPGGDLTYLVQTAPGVVMNTQSGWGTFVAFGTTSFANIFTLNGQNQNDGYVSQSTTGATNMLLGQNDIQEMTVVNNGYLGQYGTAAATVNYVTKSGANDWHGNAVYAWNGRALNGNNFFNNRFATDRPFVNVNTWAASVGGPIRKNKVFFFLDNEGHRMVMPISQVVRIPTSQFQAATLANLQAVSPESMPFYRRMFGLWNDAPGAGGATDTLADEFGNGRGCPDDFTLGGAPCALQFQSTVANLTHEWLLTGRVDWNIGANDAAFIHFRTDHGLQTANTDPINPLFNGFGPMPSYQGQINETHVFSGRTANQFILSGSWYSALYQAPAGATQVMPFSVMFQGGAFSPLGQFLSWLPQGRRVSQYQFVDDLSHQAGRHTLKFGVNFLRTNITDYDVSLNTTGSIQTESLTSFFNGENDGYFQSFIERPSQPFALYRLGFYGQDTWRVRSNLSLTLALRGERYSNITCRTSCFNRLAGSFTSLSHDVDQPYNAVIHSSAEPFAQLDGIQWQPRVGFSWTPFGSRHSTVVRGGIGLFADAIVAGAPMLYMLGNPPSASGFFVPGGALSPDVAGNMMDRAASANASFRSSFANGGTLQSMAETDPWFVPPALGTSEDRMHFPRYQEWSLELQQGLGQNALASLKYVGNHGLHEFVANPGLNAYCDLFCLGALGANASAFAGLPTAVPDARFGPVLELENSGVSNYNGLVLSLEHRAKLLTVRGNYMFSHALDELSNTGVWFSQNATNMSVVNQVDPHDLHRYNYGNAAYDVRHYASMNWVLQIPHRLGPRALLSGWTVSGTLFARSGFPFTITDSSAAGVLAGGNYAGAYTTVVFANLVGTPAHTCGREALDHPCLSLDNFTPAVDGFGAQRRNQFYGPGFFNMDLSILKDFRLPLSREGITFSVGANLFNALNHPNFDQPAADIADPQFGTIRRTVNPPTGIFGASLGGDNSPRLVQLTARITF